MRYFKIAKNKDFIGRTYWWKRLKEIDKKNEASVIVIYGRRRVGKTELIEQFFSGRNVLKFEGIQPDRKTKTSAKNERKRQITECLRRLGKYAEKEREYKYIKLDLWSEFFEILIQYIEKDDVVLYFDEIQWLSNYKDEFLAELKPFWDDILRKNRKLRIFFSGSSPSFVVGQFMSNTAFYNRSENLIHLQPFNLMEINEYLAPKGPREVMLAAITTSGVCEYLKQIKDEPSIYTGLCYKSFTPTSFFSIECDKVFISSLSANRHYRKIVDYLAKNKFANRNEIYNSVIPGKKNSDDVSPGGSFTVLLDDLESLGFINKYSPLFSKIDNSRLTRYCICDEYLHFYFKFIKPKMKEINNGKFINDPLMAINSQNFAKAMGFSFERWCRKNEMLFARIMHFGNVEYQAGAFFSRNTNEDMPGFQIDLMYIRKDSKIIICEIKYYDEEVGSSVERQVAKKIELFRKYNIKYKNYTFEKVLITTEGKKEVLAKREFFDYIITFDDIFNPDYWRDT
jgi:AAA+ ATPase superfamily predicted ATPase